ncbi:MAG: hypothetical protein J0L66_15915 [Cytophagales bacterium]|nr:hypothetical protein [Cytophagales bacterium]
MEESDSIDMYLKGELEPDQLDDFQKRLATDEQLKQKLSIRKLVIAGISQAYADNLKYKLIEFDRSLEPKKRMQFSWKMAAVVTFFVSAGAVLYFSIQKPNPLEFDIAEPGLPNTMGINSDVALNNAMNTFKTGDFHMSGKQFKDLLDSNPVNDTLLYFSGICDFRTSQTESAIKKWIYIDGTSEFSIKANYRLAIAYWLNGDKIKARELLNGIINSNDEMLQTESKAALDAIK